MYRKSIYSSFLFGHVFISLIRCSYLLYSISIGFFCGMAYSNFNVFIVSGNQFLWLLPYYCSIVTFWHVCFLVFWWNKNQKKNGKMYGQTDSQTDSKGNNLFLTLSKGLRVRVACPENTRLHTHTSRQYNILILMLHLCNSCGLASHVLGGFSLFPEYEIWTQTMMMRNFFIFRLFGYSWSTCPRCFHFHFLFSFFCVFICFHYPFSCPIFLAVSMTIVKNRFLFASSPTDRLN